MAVSHIGDDGMVVKLGYWGGIGRLQDFLKGKPNDDDDDTEGKHTAATLPAEMAPTERVDWRSAVLNML